MLRPQRAEPAAALCADRATYPDRLILRTRDRLSLVAMVQRAEHLLPTMMDGTATVGHLGFRDRGLAGVDPGGPP